MKKIFIKQTHTDFRGLFGIVFVVVLWLIILVSVRQQMLCWGSVLILIIALALCLSVAGLLNSFGLYIDESELFYKKITKEVINVNSIYAVKITKSEIDGKFGRRNIKDFHGNNLYSMVFLYDIKDEMRDYKLGDTMFMHEFKEFVYFYTIYDENLLGYIQTLNPTMVVI